MVFYELDKDKYVMQIDTDGRLINKVSKIEAHIKGIGHKAFSILIFNKDGKMLIQKRAKIKYHSGGLWSNTCCGHQITDNLLMEAKERLFEELGFMCELKELFRFHYNQEVSSGMIENEVDDVLIGIVDFCDINPNEKEVEDVKWVELSTLVEDVKNMPEQYTIWFRIIIDMIWDSYKNSISEIL